MAFSLAEPLGGFVGPLELVSGQCSGHFFLQWHEHLGDGGGGHVEGLVQAQEAPHVPNLVDVVLLGVEQRALPVWGSFNLTAPLPDPAEHAGLVGEDLGLGWGDL